MKTLHLQSAICNLQSPLVTIMMPAYNAEHFIVQAVDSVVQQTYPNWELVIVNDGSADSTPELLAAYADPRIRIFTQPNAGESAARNRALREARGEYVAFLDADDLHLPDHLEATVSYLRAHPEHAGVYTDGHYCDSAGRIGVRLASRRRGIFEGDLFEELVRASDVFVAPVCVVLRREVIERAQLTFDPEIVIGPDWDFLIRYAEIGAFGYVDRATCLYRVHDTNISVRTDQSHRARSLARCREKAIKTQRFGHCSAETRTFVFYDLLINLLPGCEQRQAAIVGWDEFRALPAAQQARLLRLMASRALANGGTQEAYAEEWLRQARQLNRKDLRVWLLSAGHQISPSLCRLALRLKARRSPTGLPANPFAGVFAQP